MKFTTQLILGVTLGIARIHAQSSIVVGDMPNDFAVIGSLPSNYGWAQEFTIANGVWNPTSAAVFVGNQFPGNPAVPVVQIRNAAGDIPGNTVLDTFTMNPNDIPSWEFGINHLAAVSAPADSSNSLGPGTYWLCMMNFAPPGSYDSIDVGFANTNPLQQSGTSGNIVNTATMATWDGTRFQHVSPTFPYQSLLVELSAQPVPEPSTLVLAGIGGIVLLLSCRRVCCSGAVLVVTARQ